MLQHDTLTIEVMDVLILEHSRNMGCGNFAAPLVLPHSVVQPFAPVAGLTLGVGDGIDDVPCYGV